jgi:hypothetical protein
MGPNNGHDNIVMLEAIRREQKEELTNLETILSNSFKTLIGEVSLLKDAVILLRESLVNGLLNTIKVLCYCMMGIVAWVTSIKALTSFLDKM